ncbi:Neural-cadherin-like 23, partial [Homarus americanus]
MLGVTVQDVGVGTCAEAAHDTHEAARNTHRPAHTTQRNTHTTTHKTTHTTHQSAHQSTRCVGGCRAWAVLGDGFSVVDAKAWAVVGPRMGVETKCGCGNLPPPAYAHTCTPQTCLNGGRCLPTPTGTRCVCPHGTWGFRCKILMRHFEGSSEVVKDSRDAAASSVPRDHVVGGGNPVGGWAWVASIPACPEVHISLEILTTSENATLLYSGPDDLAPPPGTSSGEVVVLEVRGGRPYLLLDLGGGPVTLALTASYSLADSAWHRIDLIWKDELVEMIVDLCSGGSIDGPPTPPTRPAHNQSAPPIPPPPIPPDAHTCRGAARLPRAARVLNTPQPLQVGGLAHPPPAHTVYGWPEPPTARPLHGCVRNLRV